MKILFVLQVSAVLAYSHENIVDPFLEPVLGLAQALLEKDQQEMHRNMDGIVPASTFPPHPLNPPPLPVCEHQSELSLHRRGFSRM